MSYIDIIFNGPPGPEAGRFIEVEDHNGCSIHVGEWIDRGDGLWALRLQNHSYETLRAEHAAELAEARRARDEALLAVRTRFNAEIRASVTQARRETAERLVQAAREAAKACNAGWGSDAAMDVLAAIERVAGEVAP